MKFAIKLIIRTLIIILVLETTYLSILWFQHNIHIEGKVPVSSFMRQYLKERETNPKLPEMQWEVIPISAIPEQISRVFLIAEDSQFYVHNGLDTKAIRKVLKQSLSGYTISRGASTITQQTAKNLYLYPKRSWIRKWHELIFALLLELTQRKDRILELYLNTAEFGRGIYGIQAAAQHYFGIPAKSLNVQQAAYLAAALPWPRRHNFKTGTKTFDVHARRIYSRSIKERLPGE